MKLLLALLSVAGVSGLVWVSPVLGALKDTATHKTGRQGVLEDTASLKDSLRIAHNGEMGRLGERVLKDTATHKTRRFTAKDLLAQGVTRVTGVEVIQTDDGLELILKTVRGSDRLVPLIIPQGNDLVIDILDATLGFSIRNGVIETNPAPGIRRIAVNKGDANSIRVRISGEDRTPDAEIVTGRDDLVLNIAAEGTIAEEEANEEIEVIATGEAEEEDSYIVEDANVGTRADTPVKDIPQSIQVVPQEVIKDQGATSVIETIRNSSGVVSGADSPRDPFENFDIRGFDASENTLTNGLQDPTNGRAIVTNNIERIEILKGPASVLFGQGTVGGTVNYETKQPLDEPFYQLEFSAGNFNLYSGALDFSAPLTEGKPLAYRLNGLVKT
ncbi:MAG: TonB-dependent receptor plug domain-containing protein, partial [Pleurocapsa sp.]